MQNEVNQGAAPPAPPGRPRVIYVMGAGRSGSTILGVTLGNCTPVFYAGELDAWLSRSGEPQLDGGRRAEFWARVRDAVDGAAELYGRTAQRAIERSLSLFRVHLWRERRRLAERYREVSENLYRAIAAAAGTQVIVDTSHYPLRARELQRLTGIDLHLVYLMRDPRSVVASFKRTDVAQYSKSTLTTNVYLWLTTLLSVLVFLRHPRERRLLVRYEDFIADPRRILGDILAPLQVAALPEDLSALRTGIPFQGNRLIHREVIALENGSAGQPPRSGITTLLQLPWLAVVPRLRPVAGESSPRAGVHAPRQ